MKKPIISMSNDWHLNEKNIQSVFNAVREQCEHAVKNGIKYLIFGGDLFTSRVSQRQDVLEAMTHIFDIVSEYSLTAYAIPGNHDKTNYESYSSFLAPFRSHPNVTILSEGHKIGLPDGVQVYFMPFFKYGCEAWDREFEHITSMACTHKGKNILFGHFAVEGSINNDGSAVAGGLKRSDLKDFDKVFLGHYHNTHVVNKDIVHTPSLLQNNYGEDNNKGFTIIYDDLSYDIVKTTFDEFKIFQFNLDNTSIDEIIEVANEVHTEPNIRFEFIGSRDRVKGFNAKRFEEMGINVKKLYEDIEAPLTESAPTTEISTWNETRIINRFEKFCKENKLDHDKGLVILTKIIEKSNGKE